MRIPRIALLATLPLWLACALDTSKPDGAWAAGKADGLFEITEAGPLALGESTRVELAGSVPAFRVESYGGTRIQIDLRAIGPTDAYVVVEGPLAGDGDSAPPGFAAKLAEDDDSGDELDSALEVTLPAPGVYRVLAGTFPSLSQGRAPVGTLELEAWCTENCSRPSMSAAELVRTLRAAGQLEALTSAMTARIAQLVPDTAQRAAIEAELATFLNGASTSDAGRFPVLPLRQLGTLRAALGLVPSEPSPAASVVESELMSLLGACDATRGRPGPVDARIPALGNGHFPNRALTTCQVAHGQRLAGILVSLAANNGSRVTYRGVAHSTPRSLFEALVQSGHAIEVRNERTYANFISFTWEERDVVWPVWLDAGLAVDGAPLVIPMGHSHHAWRISGPDVNARVMFYLGIDGAAFFAQTQSRPAWTGEFVSDGASSDEAGGLAHVLATLDAASAYYRRIETESSTVAAGLPADGYGFLGVCNDSNAAIEHVTRGTITTFPLMRAASLDGEASLGDGLDATVRALPHDADVAPARRDALQRVLLMTPLDATSTLYPPRERHDLDALLARQLVSIRAELAAGARVTP